MNTLQQNIDKALKAGMPSKLGLNDIKEFSVENAKELYDVFSDIVSRRHSENSVHYSRSGIEFVDGKVRFFIDYWWSNKGSWTGWNENGTWDVVSEENLERVNKVVLNYIKYIKGIEKARKTNKVTKELLQKLINDNEHILKKPERKSAKGYAEIAFGKLNREKEGSEREAIIARYSDGSYHQRILVGLSDNGDYYINVATPLCGEYEVDGLFNYDLLSKAVAEAWRFITCKD